MEEKKQKQKNLCYIVDCFAVAQVILHGRRAAQAHVHPPTPGPVPAQMQEIRCCCMYSSSVVHDNSIIFCDNVLCKKIYKLNVNVKM